MATSAAAVSTHMGNYQDKMELFRNLQVILGFSGGRSLNVNPRSTSSPQLVRLFIILLLIAMILLVNS